MTPSTMPFYPRTIKASANAIAATQSTRQDSPILARGIGRYGYEAGVSRYLHRVISESEISMLKVRAA